MTPVKVKMIRFLRKFLLSYSNSIVANSFSRYGTRQSMRAFVLVDKSGLSQSLYTKYLLKHLQTQESVGSLFEQLNCSFTRNEDASIVAKMKPEYKDSTRQKFSLSAPLRQSSASKLHREFFKYCRIEPMAPNFEDYMQCSLGLCWNQESNWYVQTKIILHMNAILLLKITFSVQIGFKETPTVIQKSY